MDRRMKMTLANGFSFEVTDIIYGDIDSGGEGYIVRTNVGNNATIQSLFHKLERYLTKDNISNVKVEFYNGQPSSTFSFTEVKKVEIIMGKALTMVQFIVA